MSDYEDDDNFDDSGDYDDDHGNEDEDDEHSDQEEDEENIHKKEDEENYFDEEEPEMMAERAAFERTEMRKGFSRKQSIMDNEKRGKEAWKGRLEQTDEENFSDDLDLFYIPNRDSIDLGQRDFDIVNALIDIVPHIKCKNPAAFLLAYYTIDASTKKINRDRLLKDKKYRSLMNEKEITTEDIIRYCRLLSKYI